MRDQLIALFLVAGILITPAVYAREWYIKPSASFRLEVDDNIQLRQNEKKGVFGLIESLFADIGTRTETSNINLRALLKAYQYWGQDNLNRVNVYLYENSDFQLTERASIGLDADYVHDNSLTSELDATGLTQFPIPRNMFNLAPHWSYALSELQSVQAGYTHEEVTYDNNTIAFLTSYKADSINLSYQHQWREDIQYYLAFSSLWYQVTDFDRQTQNYNITSGLEYRYSETLDLNFMLGVRFTATKTSFNGFETKDSSIGPLFGFGLKKRFELGIFDFDYNRSITPSGAGQLLQVDRISLSSLYNVTEHLDLNLLARIHITDAGENVIRNISRIYYLVEPKIIWNFNRQFNMSASYRFRMQKYDTRDGNAVSNGFFVTFNYQWDKLSTNRF